MTTSPPPLDQPLDAGPLADPGFERPQPNLFDPDDAALDLPVPYTLTVQGRRVVDDVPALRVVPEPAGDDQFVADLEHTDTWRQARVRALTRSGRSPVEIAADLDLSESVVRLWVTNEEAPADAGPSVGTVGSGRDTHRDSMSEDGAADVRGRAILAACGTVEVGAVVVTTSRIAVAAELVTWLRQRHEVSAGSIRVVLRVADHATADLVARAWADRLGLTPDRVTTVSWSRAPGPRSVQAVVRATGRDLAERLAATLRGWPD